MTGVSDLCNTSLLEKAMPHFSLHSILQAFAPSLPKHDLQVATCAWLRGISVALKVELEPIFASLPDPSKSDAVTQIIRGNVGQPSPPVNGQSIGYV